MAVTVRGACPLDCPDTCSWLVTVEHGRAIDLRGDREHPFTRGALCGKVDHYLDALYDPNRLLHPLKRVGAKGEGRFERISWDEALELVADGMRGAIERHGPESVLPYYHAGTMGMIQGRTMGDRLFAALGASRLALTICDGAAQEALATTLGAPVGYDPEDLGLARLVVLWGANPLASNVHQWRFVLEARERGAHVVTIDPLRTDTARRSGEHVAPLPGTDGALALGLMRAVLDTGAEDRDWLARHAIGWPELEERLSEWPVERAAAVCGLDEAVVRALGDRLAETRPAALRIGLGLQRHGGAAAAIRAICAIPAVTGDWRYPGGGALCMTEGHVPVDVGQVSHPADLPRPPARTVNMSRLASALTELDEPPVAALVVYDSNPAATAPNQLRVREGLAREDLFTVVLEQCLTDTTDFADVVLPATMQPEHADLHSTYGQLYVSWNEPAVEPAGECLPNAEIFRRIAAAVGLDHPRLRDSDLEVARQLLDTPACRALGLTLERLRDEGYVRCADFERGTAPFAEGGFPTPSGKVELWSERLAAGGHDPLVGYVPSYEAGDPELTGRYPLVLISPATRFFISSMFASLPWHRSKVGPPAIFLHPDDADERGIAPGDHVRVWNDRGSFQAEAAVDEAARPGVAFTFKAQWPKLSPDGRNVNATTPERDTDLGGGPTFHDNRVQVELVRSRAGDEPAVPAVRARHTPAPAATR
jgi:anaerobic selenocysteine-containing dehydrogenase